jgi:hypothetical protein
MNEVIVSASLDDYMLAIGRLTLNLLSLELVMRLFLNGGSTTPDRSRDPGFDLFAVAVGDNVIENALTNYDSLGQVIKKYNANVSKAMQVDESVVELRDAFAHGRILSDRPQPPMRLFKFSQPTGHGTVMVTHAQTLELDWILEQASRVGNEIRKVETAIRSR